MREFGLSTLNTICFVLLGIIFVGFQTSLWLQVLGYTPAPHFWLIIANYWIMFRNPTRSVLMSYLIAFTLIAMTGMPLPHLFGVLLLNFCILYLLKDRVLWGGPTQFMLACGGSSAFLAVSKTACSFVFDTTLFFEFQFFDWILSSLFTALFALPCYSIFMLIDKLTLQENPKNTATELI